MTMGMIDDIKDALEDFVGDMLKDAIEGCMTTVSDLVSSTFTMSTEDDGFLKTFLTGHPAKFTGASDGSGTTIWSIIETVCNNVVVPIGGFVLTIILLNDLIQQVIRGNNFKEFDDSIFIKWIIKAFCGVLLVSNVFYIASGVFSLGTSVCAGALSELFETSVTFDTITTASLTNNIGKLAIILIVSAVEVIAVFVMFAAIIVTLASRIIEVFMYLGISPIPMATMMDSGDWGGIGKSWVKQLLALSFQGFFIIIALAIFSILFGNTISNLNDGYDVTLQVSMLLGYTVALIFTILRTGSISKAVFNAH